MPSTDAGEPEIPSFLDFLGALRNGTVADQATAKMNDIVREVRATGRGGKVTVEITFKTFKGNDAQIEVGAIVSAKRPAPDPVAAIFYADKHGGLHRNDPLQPQLPLITVPRNPEGPLS